MSSDPRAAGRLRDWESWARINLAVSVVAAAANFLIFGLSGQTGHANIAIIFLVCGSGLWFGRRSVLRSAAWVGQTPLSSYVQYTIITTAILVATIVA
jgi:hypothetical protein